MPQPGVALDKLGFLTIGLFDGQDPGPGHQVTLEMIELGERLGFDSAWVRHRHLQYGISSPVAVLAAASQRTARIELGTAVIPLGWENPLRLAEDLATVDILSGGRLNPGFSAGSPMNWEAVREALYPDTWNARTSPTSGCPGCCGSWRASPRRRCPRRSASSSSHRASSRTPRPAVADVVRRRIARVGEMGGRKRREPPDVFGGEGRGVGGLRRRAAVAHQDVPRVAPRGRGGPGVAGPGGDTRPTRRRPRSGTSTRRTSRPGRRAPPRRPGRPG